MNTLNRVVLLTSIFIVASCGGGGGGGSSDGGSGSGGGYGNTNSAPVINNTTTDISVQENQTSAFTVDASDADNDTLTYSLSGDDSGSMSIASGVVTFNTAPDFENPSDADANNIYAITVTVSDGSATASKNFTVTVTNDTSDDVTTEGMDGTYVGAGPIQSATVCIEVDSGTCAGASYTTTTASDGTFSLTIDSGITGVLRGEGGFDPVTNLQFGNNSGFALGQPVTDQNFVVSPLSSIMNDFNNSTEYETFKTNLGISSDFMIRFNNPYTNLSNASANKAAVVNTQILILEKVLKEIGVTNAGQEIASAIYSRTGDETSLGDTTFIKDMITNITSISPTSDQLVNLSAGISAYLQKVNANDSSKSHSHFAKVGMSSLSDAMKGVMDGTTTQTTLDTIIFDTNTWIQSDTDWGSTAYVDNESEMRTTTYSLSNSGSSYYSVDNVNAKDTDFIIYIRDGDVIKFDPTSSVTSAHPFHLSTEQDDMDQSGDIGAAEGWDQDSLTLTVSEATPTDLYAHCRFHPGMYAKGRFVRVASDFDMANIDVTGAAAATPMKIKGTVKSGPFKGASGFTYKVYLTRQNESDHTHEFYEYPGLTFYMPGGQGYHGSETASNDAMFKTKSHFATSSDDGDDDNSY